MILILMLSSCSNEVKRPLVISVDTWIGASPLYYAHAKGWLKEANIEMLLAPSIDENLRMFESGASDIFTGTEHEYFRELKKHPDLIPFIIYDRSFGGDLILSTQTEQELLDSNETIHIYLERDTVNEDMANYWIKYNNISTERIVLHHRSQDEIVHMKADEQTVATIAITYNPNNIELEKNGFKEIASSKDDRYLVIDGIYTSSHLYKQNLPRLHKLNESLKRGLTSYKKEPLEFYETVKPYLGNLSYKEFMAMQGNIKWLLGEPQDILLEQMEAVDFPTKEILR